MEKILTGEMIDDEADVVVSARGALNAYAWPKIDEFGAFSGKTVHSAAWDDS